MGSYAEGNVRNDERIVALGGIRRRDWDLNPESRMGAVFKTAALPDYAISA